jgi:hypothetical protein
LLGGTLRDFLNAILVFIGSTSLTDVEFDGIDGELAYGYNQATYSALSLVLDSRESVSSLQDRLKYFFQSKGVTVSEVVPAGKTNIYIGDVLE